MPLIDQLLEARDNRDLRLQMRPLETCDLLILDEFGYQHLSGPQASMLFQLFAARHEQKSTYVTTNLEFSKWADILGDHILAAALVDRFAHKSVLLNMNGPSFRLTEGREATKKKDRPPRLPPERHLRGPVFSIARKAPVETSVAFFHRSVSLYHEPPEDAVVLCIDEKSGMQANERKYGTQRPLPGKPGRYEHEYIRHGTQSLLAAFNIRTGEVTAHCGSTRKAEHLLTFMEDVASRYSDAKRMVVIWDNLNIHHDGPSQRWTTFNKNHDGKFEFYFTPLHASWVNQVEIFFSILHRRCLKYGSFSSQEDLRRKVLAFIERWNTNEGHPFKWSLRGYPMQLKAVA